MRNLIDENLMAASAEVPIGTKQDWNYENNEVLVLPYLPQSADNGLPEDFLVRLYLQTKQDGLLERTFLGFKEPVNLNRFITYLAPHTMLIGIVKATNEVAGWSWIYDVSGPAHARKASFAFCYFRKFWGTQEIRALARFGLRWCFEKGELAALFGMRLPKNRLAAQFATEMGFRLIGRVPLFFEDQDAEVICLRRDEFFNGGVT